MRAVVFVGDRQLELKNVPDPTPGPGEAVLQMKASGMCGSDLKFYRAPRGAAQSALGLGGSGEAVIAGHEPCGVVAAVGPGVPEALARPGMRVMQHHYAGCGVCEHCRVGWSQLCPNGFKVFGVTGNGGHADYMLVPARTLVPLPDALSFETGAAISCGTGTAYGALRRMNLSGVDSLAVFGQGPVGLSATQLAKAMGARVYAVDVGKERRALAKDFGADHVIDPAQDDPVAALKELTHGRGVDKSLDCSGNPQARAAAVRSLRTWGTACFVGEGDTVTLDVSQDLIRKQLTVIASWTFSAVGQAECARFVAEHGIDVDRLFTHRWKLEQAAEAYRLFDTQTTGKGVFLM
jgi:2-desacetyl-2-hydroxyethyl bacteriochlorophyllide A dehydrogenase